MKLDLTKGICETDQYKAWKFPGGEIHVKLKINIIDDEVNIVTRLNSSDDIMFLLIINDVLRKNYKHVKRTLYLPYMPYQQADRDFGIGECFSLKTVTNLINSMNFETVYVLDPHSEVSPGLIDNCYVYDNSTFIKKVIELIYQDRYFQVMHTLTLPDNPDFYKKMSGYNIESFNNELVMLATDAGSYKKIFKLCEKLNFKGDIITCSKSRNHDTGEITTVVPEFDEEKTVLIIDDIALGSRTFFNIRKELKNKNVYLAVSHGVFNENVDKLETEFTKVFTTNSRRDESIGKNIEVIKIF